MRNGFCEAKALLVRAEEAPLPGVIDPGTHQRYRYPKLSIEKRLLNSLKPDFLRVKMIYTGLCGTDIHLVHADPLTGYVRSSAPATIPSAGRVIGHEGVGQVLECGDSIQCFSPGDIVAFESIITCFRCQPCRRGAFNQCINAQLFGMEVDGLLSNIADVPASLAHQVSNFSKNDNSMMAAACLEPAGVAWTACEQARLSGGDEVLIFGGGPIGIFCAMMAKLIFGASRVLLVDPIEKRRILASQWCDQVYDLETFFHQKNCFPDVVIEASGCMENIQKVFRFIKPNGRVVLLARSGASLQIDAVDHLITNAISIVGSRGHLGGAFHKIQTLYKMGRLPLHLVVTGVLDSLESLQFQLQKSDQLMQDHCKVLLKW